MAKIKLKNDDENDDAHDDSGSGGGRDKNRNDAGDRNPSSCRFIDDASSKEILVSLQFVRQLRGNCIDGLLLRSLILPLFHE